MDERKDRRRYTSIWQVALAVLAFVLAALPAHAQTCAESDVNGDGDLNVLDMVVISNALGSTDEAADVNNDGSVNVLDLVAFVNAMNGDCTQSHSLFVVVTPEEPVTADRRESVTFSIAVEDQDGQPVPEATIGIEDGVEEKSSQQTADENGHLTYVTDVPCSKQGGSYRIAFSANKSGYEPSSDLYRDVQVPFQRTEPFAGRTWVVRSICGGPGGDYRVDGNPEGNFWADDDNSVWVDSEGRLHLTLRQIDGEWHSTEVFTKTLTSYGLHRFKVIGPLDPDSLDVNVVVGLYAYRDDCREIDIEFSRWGDASRTDNGQYVIQPSPTKSDHKCSATGGLEPFPVNLQGSYSTHYFDWQANSVYFKSFHGHYNEPPEDTDDWIIHEWQYTGSNIPSESDSLKVYMNLWLVDGAKAPKNLEEVEVLIQDVDLP